MKPEVRMCDVDDKGEMELVDEDKSMVFGSDAGSAG